jgi:hypothetical protein
MDIGREWAAFAGAQFTLMGISLGAAARVKAEDALSWERQWRAAVGAGEPAREEAPRLRRLTLAYRLGGAFFAALGAVLLFSAATGRRR